MRRPGAGDNFIKLHKIGVFSSRITQGVTSGIHGSGIHGGGQFAIFGDGQITNGGMRMAG